ncbi:MAG: hypothetical protein NWR30_09110 [Salibacteraceae bacterium]|nr:hypothetical protein [Salibacteraceae bacterium]
MKPKTCLTPILKTAVLCLTIFYFFSLNACKKENEASTVTIAGKIINEYGLPLGGIKLYYTENEFISTETDGTFRLSGLTKNTPITPTDTNYIFAPNTISVATNSPLIVVNARPKPNAIDLQIEAWFKAQQVANGLMKSGETGDFVSLYDNALAAYVFMANKDFESAANIFDFFKGRINSELKVSPGGFSQFRNAVGTPNKHRWLGDNAWLLMAINTYKSLTNATEYDELASELETWIRSLQDTDGGVYSGFDSNGDLLDYKVTEGNIDAFCAIPGYDDFHKNVLQFFEDDRWEMSDQNLVAWRENPQFLYALDVHAWSYCCFKNYTTSALSSADRFLCTKTVTLTGMPITGYCFDEDQDVVWLEGTGQMALAYRLAGNETEANYYLNEMLKAYKKSETHENAGGFPYAANQGTSYGGGPLWESADKEIALSSAAWYILARHGFNPFSLAQKKAIPAEDMFWLP